MLRNFLKKRSINSKSPKRLGSEILKVRGNLFTIEYFQGPRSYQGNYSIIAQTEYRGRPISINDCGYGLDHARILIKRLIFLTLDSEGLDYGSH